MILAWLTFGTPPAAADIATTTDPNGAVTGSGSLGGDGEVSVELANRRGGAGGAGVGRGRRSGGTAGTWVGYDVGVCGANGEQWFDIAVNDLGRPTRRASRRPA